MEKIIITTPQSDNLVSYEEMMERVGLQMEQTLVNPDAFNTLVTGLRHGETSSQIEELQGQQSKRFGDWSEKLIPQIISERKGNPATASQVENITSFDLEMIKNKAQMHYVVERDLVGPLIFHFASSIRQWQKEGKLPGLTVGMLRDFQPFYIAAKKLGADVSPWYLRRALFNIGDELDTDDVVKDGGDHSTKLAFWLKPLLTASHVNLLDSGCWGTVVYEIAGLRSIVNWLVNSGYSEQVMNLSPAERINTFRSLLPKELEAFLNTGFNLTETETRWKVMYAIVGNDQYLASIHDLKGQQLTTTALDHYSHPWRDPRVPNHQLIYSHIDVVGEDVMPSPIFGELINDTIEENHASKIYKGPTSLTVNNGSVSVLLEKNESLVEEFSAWASCKGVEDAVEIALKKKGLGISFDPKETIAHIVYLAHKADNQQIFTGVLPHNTPTWSKGHHFLSDIWPQLANNPYSTYKPFNV